MFSRVGCMSAFDSSVIICDWLFRPDFLHILSNVRCEWFASLMQPDSAADVPT
jgi:hypothetical protein